MNGTNDSETLRKNTGIAAGLIAAVTVFLMAALYYAEFSYPNTEAGRLAAIKEYVMDRQNGMKDFYADTPVRAAAYGTVRNELVVFFVTDHPDHIRGIVRMERGLNGRYRPFSASYAPFPYTGGVSEFSLHDMPDRTVALAGDNCQGISAVKINLLEMSLSGTGETTALPSLTLPVENDAFLWILSVDEIAQKLEMDPVSGPQTILIDDIRFLNGNGTDITEQFEDANVKSDWGSGIGSAETHLVYWLMGILAAIGAILAWAVLKIPSQSQTPFHPESSQ